MTNYKEEEEEVERIETSSKFVSISSKLLQIMVQKFIEN